MPQLHRFAIDADGSPVHEIVEIEYKEDGSGVLASSVNALFDIPIVEHDPWIGSVVDSSNQIGNPYDLSVRDGVTLVDYVTWREAIMEQREADEDPLSLGPAPPEHAPPTHMFGTGAPELSDSKPKEDKGKKKGHDKKEKKDG